jgi:hypothetical protein
VPVTQGSETSEQAVLIGDIFDCVNRHPPRIFVNYFASAAWRMRLDGASAQQDFDSLTAQRINALYKGDPGR